MDVAHRVAEQRARLTPAERRIAEHLLVSPQTAGFGTVAEVAAAARVGTATVVRFAAKLGYTGYAALQEAVQGELIGRLRPAAERIREHGRDAAETGRHRVIERHAAIEMANVTSTIHAVDGDALDAVVARLGDTTSPVLVASGTASNGVASQFANDLDQLRPGVSLVDGNAVAVHRALAMAGDGATLVALDLRRYERWLVELVTEASARDMWIVALTDSVISPLASLARHTFVIAADATGPFDSHVGSLALCNLVVAGVAAAQRDVAADRLDRLEASWSSAALLTDS